MVFLCSTFLRQLLTVLTVMLSGPDMGRFIIRHKHVRVSTKQVGSDRTVGWRATFEGLSRWQPACGSKDEGQKGEDSNAELRNDNQKREGGRWSLSGLRKWKESCARRCVAN